MKTLNIYSLLPSIKSKGRLFLLMTVALLCYKDTIAASVTAPPCIVLDPELQGRYSGGCLNGLAEGDGEAIGKARYEGRFVAGQKQGKGIKTWPNGDRYEGAFFADRKEGFGVYSWGERSSNPGEKYAGYFTKDLRQGTGFYQWPDGDRYEGSWENDHITGTPTLKMFDRARLQLEQRAALIVGTTVCQKVSLGMGHENWLKGTLLESTDRNYKSLKIRITNSGDFHQGSDGQLINVGDIIDSPFRGWVPCL